MAIIRGQQVSTQLSGSYIISGSTQELIADSITLTGNVTASGVIKADAFESVVGGTTIDFNDDINIEGDDSASSTSTGSFGRAEIFGNIKAKVTSGGHTVDLSSVDGSEINQLSSAQSDGMYNSIHMKNSSGINLLANSVKLQIQNESGTPYYQFSTTQFKARQTNQEIINFSKVSGSSSSTFSGGTSTFTDYGGNVSGSATSTGSFGILQLRGSDSQAVIDFTRATSNTIIGFANTGAGITTGAAGNTLIGYQVGQLITTGDHNVAIGQENLSQGNSTGNTAVGYRALKAVTTAIGNVGIGRNAADALQSGNFNIGIGQGADLGSTTAEHRIVIGHDAAATADNQTVIGGSTQTQVIFGGDALISGSAKSTGSFGLLTTPGALTVGGDATIEGKVTALEFHTEFVSSSIKFSSGSTKFGDTADDLHNFTGSIRQSGSAQDHYFLTGNVGIGTTSPDVSLHVKLADTANARIEDNSTDGIAKLDFKNDQRTATIGVYGDDSDKFKIDHGGGAVMSIDVAQNTAFVGDVNASKSGSFKDLINSGNMFSTHLTGSFSGSFHGEVGARFIFNKSTAATTWNIQHNFGTKYPNVTVYDSNDVMVIPTSVTATDSHNMTLTFSSAVAGIAMLGLGGMSNNVTGRTSVHTNSTSEIWRVTHSLGEKFPAITVYDETDRVIIPESIRAVDASHTEITFQDALSGNAHFSVGNGLPGISSANAGKFMKVNGAGTHITYETPAFDATGSLGVTGSIEIFGSGSISGSSTGTGSFGHLIVAGNVSASGIIRADSFESVTAGDSVNFADSVNVVGSITASSGISLDGNLTGSSTSTGSFGSLYVNDRIGLGITNPADYDTAAINPVVIGSGASGGNNAGISVISSTSGYGALYFGDGTGNAVYRGAVEYNHSDDSLKIWTGATTGTGRAITIDSSNKTTFGNEITGSSVLFTTAGAWNRDDAYPFNFINLDAQTAQSFGMLVRGGANAVGGKIFTAMGYDGKEHFNVFGNGQAHIYESLTIGGGIRTAAIGNERMHIHRNSANGSFMRFTNTNSGHDDADNSGVIIGQDDNEQAQFMNQENANMTFGVDKIERLQITTDNKISGSAISTGSFGQLHLGGGNSAANPTLNFGDGNTGIRESEDNQMRFVANGSDVFRLDAGGFFGGSAGHPYMIKEVASSTNPVFTFTSDTNTGIGQAGADTGSLVAGGTNVLNWRGDGHVGVGTTTPEGALHVMQSSTSVPALILSDTGVIDYKYSFPDTNTLKLEVAGAADRTFQLNNTSGNFNFSLDGGITVGTHITASGNIEVTGNISGSVTSTGSFGQVIVDKNVAVDAITFDTPHLSSTSPLAPMIDGDSGNTTLTHMRFFTSTSSTRSEKMVIRHDGNVGIGVTQPAVALEVNGSISGSATSTGSFGRVHVADKVGIGVTSLGVENFNIGDVYKFFDDTTPELQIHDSDDNNYSSIAYSDGNLSFSSNAGNEGGGADTITFLTEGSTRMQMNNSGLQIGTAGNVTDVPLRVNSKILIHQDSGGAGDSELHFDRRHDGADARIKAVAGAGGAYATELHFVTTHASSGEQTVLQLDDNGHIYSDLANTKISGSSTSTGSFGSVHTAGNIGIGTTAPPSKITITSALGDGLRIQRSGFESTHYVLFDGDSINAYPAGGSLVLNNDVGSDVVMATGGGNVGIGTSNPGNLLELTGSDSGDPLLDIHNSHATNGYGMRVGAGDDNNVYTARFNNVSHAGLMTVWGGGDVEFHAANAKISGSSTSTGSFGVVHTAGHIGVGTTAPNISEGAAGSNAVTIAGSVANRNALLELKGTRANANDFSSYIRNFSNSGATPITDIQSLRGASDTSGSLRILVSNKLALSITGSNQNVGIGTDSPSEKLHVYGEAGGGYIARFQNDGNNANRYGIVIQGGADDGSGTTNYILFEDGDGGDIGVASNDSGTFSVSDLSDARKKKNIRDTKVKGLDSINAMKVRDFEWINNDMSVNAGLVAQELEEVFPDAVTEFGDDDLLAVSRERLVPVLIKAVQELTQKVEELEKKLQ